MAKARESFKAGQAGLDPRKLVFVDETGTSTKMVRVRGRCRKGTRLISPNAGSNIIAKQFANQIFLAFVAGRQHDQIGGKRIAGTHPCSFCDEPGDIGKLHQSYFTFNGPGRPF